MRYTPDDITELGPFEVFVFGSNLNGHHFGGAARTAVEKFGAIHGVGEGPQGDCYAIPTLDADMRQCPIEDLAMSIGGFYSRAERSPRLTYLVTKVGCGIAGYPIETIARLFRNPPANVILPKEFCDYEKTQTV